MPVKLTNVQRAAMRAALVQIVVATDGIEAVHDELCETHSGTGATGPKVVATMQATSAVYAVLSKMFDVMRDIEELAYPPGARRKKKMR